MTAWHTWFLSAIDDRWHCAKPGSRDSMMCGALRGEFKAVLDTEPRDACPWCQLALAEKAKT